MLCGAERNSRAGSVTCLRRAESRGAIDACAYPGNCGIARGFMAAGGRAALRPQSTQITCRSRTAVDALLAGEPQGRTALAFGAAQAQLLAPDIVARHRHHALSFRELDLAIHHVLLTERHFRSRQIELPHPHKALIVNALDLLAMDQEPRAPVLQRLGVMQAQDLHIGDEQPGSLDRWKNL